MTWQWENAVAGGAAGFATVAALHPLDVVRTRFQVNDGRLMNVPSYKNTGHAIYTIARMEGFRGLYAGFYPAVFGSTVSWGLYFFLALLNKQEILHLLPTRAVGGSIRAIQSISREKWHTKRMTVLEACYSFLYNRAKQRYSKRSSEELSPGLHLASAAEGGALVCLFTNPIWLVKTRLQLQTPLHQNRTYSGFSDALKTILKEEGWHALYKGLGPGLLLVSHGAIQFTVYEELRKVVIHLRRKEQKENSNDDKLLNSVDYAMLGASSKFAAILLTYPYQVIRARLQQRPGSDGIPKYMNSWHVIKDTFRFEGIRGFYRGMTSNLLKNVPASSITFVVYENVLSLLRLTRRNS